MRGTAITSTLLAALSLTLPVYAAGQPKNSVLLSKVQSLTLRNGLKTSHRRVSAIPQLKCVGGNAKDLYDVDVMRCKNSGSDYDNDNVQWTCTASLPEEFKLGSTDVICEGYSSPDDPYILKGSCGVEYRLVLTEAGEAKYGNRKGKKGKGGGSSSGESADTAFVYFFWVLFIGVLGWMIYSGYMNRQQPRAAPTYGGNTGGFFGGGGGGGPGDDPPPPYTPSPGYKTQPGAGSSQQGWRPGFWSGALGGAAAGYMAGNRGNQTRNADRSPLFGGGGGSSGGYDDGEGSSRRTSSSSSASSTRYQSTGFGSTSRR